MASRADATFPKPAIAPAMASITHDGQSFTINGRRRWIVGASIDYGRLPRETWVDRIRAARQAGFNTIGVRVCWAQHERRAGEFDFSGDLDVREFIRAIGKERMFAILRPGPFIDAAWDAGGLPGWLIDGHPEIVRTGDPIFKEAVSRWFSALFDQVKSLQLTSAGAGGPILLVQNDHAWFRGNEEAANASIGETARYLRESGARVPIINANNLFAAAEGELDTWIGADHVFSTLRQLRAVRPDAPPIVLDLPLGDQPAWGEKPSSPSPDAITRMLTETISAGGQFLVDSLCAGTTPDFLAGRDARDDQRYFTSVFAPEAPITAGGQRTPNYAALKRIATFASSFERVLANLDQEHLPISIQPDASGDAISVIPMTGTQGSLVTVLAPDSTRTKSVQLALPDGRPLDVPLPTPPVALLLLDTLVGRRATLDYCNLSAFANVGDVFVCYGKSGTTAELSVSGEALEATVPGGKSPVVIEHEDLTVVICSTEQIDATIATESAIYIGCEGVDAEGAPIAHNDYSTCHRFGADRSAEKIAMTSKSPRKRRPSFGAWRAAVDGALSNDKDSAAWTALDEPKPNAELGASLGYLWLRCDLRYAKTNKSKLGFLELMDRAHVFINDEPQGLVGGALDATAKTLDVSFGKGEHALTMLIDHLGRPAGGAGMGLPIGLPTNLWDVKSFKLNKPKLVTAPPVAPVKEIAGRVWELHDDEMTDPNRIQWSFTYRRLAPLYFSIDALPAPALMILNETPIAWLAPGGPKVIRFPDEPLRRGANTLDLAVLGDASAVIDDFVKAVNVTEGKEPLTKDPAWSWAPWAPPQDEQFEAVSKTQMSSYSGSPVWWNASFNMKPTDPPIAFDASGLSKGQVLINGRNLGRYVVSLKGCKINTNLPIPIPATWLNDNGSNEVTIFDEFGASPDSCKLVWCA